MRELIIAFLIAVANVILWLLDLRLLIWGISGLINSLRGGRSGS